MKLSADDVVWSRAVKKRDEDTCRRCVEDRGWKQRGMHAHHIFTRSRKATRLDLENGVTLCMGHHMWAHRNPLEFHEWIRGELGAETYEALQVRSRGPKR